MYLGSAFDEFTRAFQFAWRDVASRHRFIVGDIDEITDAEMLAFIDQVLEEDRARAAEAGRTDVEPDDAP